MKKIKEMKKPGLARRKRNENIKQNMDIMFTYYRFY